MFERLCVRVCVCVCVCQASVCATGSLQNLLCKRDSAKKGLCVKAAQCVSSSVRERVSW